MSALENVRAPSFSAKQSLQLSKSQHSVSVIFAVVVVIRVFVTYRLCLKQLHIYGPLHLVLQSGSEDAARAFAASQAVIVNPG